MRRLHASQEPLAVRCPTRGLGDDVHSQFPLWGLDPERSIARSRRSSQHTGRRLVAAPEADLVCYDTKTTPLKASSTRTATSCRATAAPTYEVSPSEFDAVNHKYGLRGTRVAKTMPESKPYCLDGIDVDALNDTSPARE